MQTNHYFAKINVEICYNIILQHIEIQFLTKIIGYKFSQDMLETPNRNCVQLTTVFLKKYENFENERQDSCLS